MNKIKIYVNCILYIFVYVAMHSTLIYLNTCIFGCLYLKKKKRKTLLLAHEDSWIQECVLKILASFRNYKDE